jgi:hypothetical protein
MLWWWLTRKGWPGVGVQQCRTEARWLSHDPNPWVAHLVFPHALSLNIHLQLINWMFRISISRGFLALAPTLANLPIMHLLLGLCVCGRWWWGWGRVVHYTQVSFIVREKNKERTCRKVDNKGKRLPNWLV